MMDKISVKIILIIIEVMSGKCIETLPILKLKSPGNLPINVQIIPMTKNIIPTMIKIFPMFIPAY
jgi:hypothetical protein